MFDAITDNTRASFKDYSVEGPTMKRDFREKRKIGEVQCWVGTIFAHFQTKKGLLLGGGQHRGWEGGFGPSSIYMLKEALDNTL